MSESDGLSLVLPFDRDTEDFALGFECGNIWATLADTDGPYEQQMHAANAEMILRIAEATGRTVSSVEDGDGWLTVSFSERVS